jgi:hypothetical protein
MGQTKPRSPHDSQGTKRVRACLQCDRPITAKATGRPRRYCSVACRKNAHLGRQSRARNRTQIDEKLARVFADEALFATTTELMRTHRSTIGGMLHVFNGGDVPAEMSGDTGIPTGSGFRWESVNLPSAFLAVAELVADHPPEKITARMVKRKLRDRLIDELRASDEFERSRRPQDGVSRPTKRKKAPAPGGIRETRDVTGNRASEVVDRQRAFERLEGLEQIAYFVYTQAQLHSSDVAAFWSGDPDRWRPFSADGTGSALETTIWFFRGLAEPAAVDEALRSALRSMGQQEPLELLDDTPLEEVDDLGRGGFLIPSNSD